MITPIRPRCSFTPEALAKFGSLIDDVERELALETPEHPPSRSSLAKKAFALARHPWTYKQLRELLLGLSVTKRRNASGRPCPIKARGSSGHRFNRR